MAGKISDLPGATAVRMGDELEIIQLDPAAGRVVNRRIGAALLRGTDNRLLAATLPAAAVDGETWRAPSVRAVLQALELADGRAVWGQTETWDAAAGAVAGRGEYRRAADRQLELGAVSAAEAGVLAAATAIRAAGHDYHAAIVAHGTGIAHRRPISAVDALPAPQGQGAGYLNQVTAATDQGAGLTRLQCRAVTGLAAGSIISLLDAARDTSPPSPLTPDDLFRVVAVDATARTVDVRDPDGVRIWGQATASWTQWTPAAPARPDSGLEIVSASTFRDGDVDVARLELPGRPPDTGTVLSFDSVAGLGDGVWPVYTTGSTVLDVVIPRGHAVSVAAGHATRLTVHLDADLPAQLPNPLTTAIPDVLVSLRHVQAEANRIAQLAAGAAAQQSAAAIPRPAHMVTLWGRFAARPADPMAASAPGDYAGGQTWTTVPTGWRTRRTDVPAGAGDVWYASGLASWSSGAGGWWTLGPGYVELASTYWERYSADGAGTAPHAIPTAQDTHFQRRDPVTGAWTGAWIPLDRRATWALAYAGGLHMSSHYPDWDVLLVAPIDWAEIDECMFSLRYDDRAAGGDKVWETSRIVGAPEWVPDDYATRRNPLYEPASTIKLWGNDLGEMRVGMTNGSVGGGPPLATRGGLDNYIGIDLKFLRRASDPASPRKVSGGAYIYKTLVTGQQYARLEIRVR